MSSTPSALEEAPTSQKEAGTGALASLCVRILEAKLLQRVT
jgi:hypothetical protein